MNIAKRSASICAAVLLTAALFQVTSASPASAIPSSCGTIISTGPSTTVTGWCTAGTGEFRIVVNWKFANPQLPGTYTTYGEWAPVGGRSTVVVVGPVIIGTFIQRR